MDYRGQDLSKQDFTGVDLSGSILAHCNITGCKFGRVTGANFSGASGATDFSGIDITNCTFEKADGYVLQSLIGAIWNGVEITRASDWLVKHPMYWAYATNAFVQIGCDSATMADWEKIMSSNQLLAAYCEGKHKINIDATIGWWNEHKQIIRDWYAEEN